MPGTNSKNFINGKIHTTITTAINMVMSIDMIGSTSTFATIDKTGKLPNVSASIGNIVTLTAKDVEMMSLNNFGNLSISLEFDIFDAHSMMPNTAEKLIKKPR